MSGLTDEEIIAKIAELQGQRPNDPSKYITESTQSKAGKRGTTTTKSQTVDRTALENDRTAFDNGPIGQQIRSLQKQLDDRNEYRKSMFGRIAGPAAYAGEIVGGPLAYLTTPTGPTLPPGTSMPGRFANLGGYGIRAGAPLLAAYFAQRAANDPGNEPWTRDISQGVATTLGGYGAYPLGRGLLESFSSVGTPAEKPPPTPPAAMQKLKKGQTGTTAINAVADLRGIDQGNTRQATYDAIKKAGPFTDAEIKSMASGMTKGELGRLTAASPVENLRPVTEAAFERWGTGRGVAANVRAIAPEAFGLPAIAGQAVQEVMFPGAPEAIRQEIEDAIPEGAKKTIQKYTDVAGPVERALTAIRLAMPGASKEEIAAKAQEAWRAAEGDRRAEAAKAEETRTDPVMERIRQQNPEPSASPQAFDEHLAQLSAHFDKLRDRYGGAPASPGAQPPIPSGGGMPGITGIPGAGGPQAALGVLPGVGGGMAGGVPGTNVIHPSTAAFLRAMMQGRALGGGQ